MQNLKIKEIIKKSRFKHYEIANVMNLTEGSFSRMLRNELTTEQFERVINAIQHLKEQYQEA